MHAFQHLIQKVRQREGEGTERRERERRGREKRRRRENRGGRKGERNLFRNVFHGRAVMG